MKKTTEIIISIACAVFFAEQIFFLICGCALPEQFGDTFMGELKYKYERLEQTEGKRIIFIGGSGTAFGYDCELTENLLKEYQTVNFGMYAGLGIRAVLDLSEDFIRNEDIVIVSPEQDPQTLSCYFNGTYMWQAADGAFYMLKGLKRNSLEQMLGTFPGFALEKLNHVIGGKQPETDSVYSRKSFNEYGDIKDEICLGNVMPEGFDPDHPVKFKKEMIQEEFICYLNSYAEKIEKKGARIWYRFCPSNRSAVENEENVEEYYRYLQKVLEFPVIGNPHNSIMDEEWFFDTNFHLNSSGKKVNTVQAVKDIKAMLGDPSSVKTDLPEKPENRSRDPEMKKQIWTKEKSSVYQDQEEIVIPKEITRIQDYSFESCKELKRIIIKQKDPSACMVGQHLLDGTNAQIFVPKEAADRYRLNYSWSVYADRIQGMEYP